MKNTHDLKIGDKLILKEELIDDFFSPITKKEFKYNIVNGMRLTLKSTSNIITVNSILDDISVWSEEDGFKYDVRWFDKYEDTPMINSIGILFDGDTTTVTYNGMTGTAKRSLEDVPSTRIGIIVATMRALQFPKDQINKVIDVLFDQTDAKEDILNELTLQDLATVLKRIADE